MNDFALVVFLVCVGFTALVCTFAFLTKTEPPRPIQLLLYAAAGLGAVSATVWILTA